jgi:undecaprenyl-diphosphatase
MQLSHALWLALIQGLTEFLPISSSGHLALVPILMGWPDQGLAFDVAVHLGSLVAVIGYFRRQLVELLCAVPDAIRMVDRPDTRLLFHLVIATLPIVLAGFLLNDWVERELRNPLVIATTTIVFGIVLLLCDRFGKRDGTMQGLDWRQAVLIGVAQLIALIPGVSRSGITLSAALLTGLSRTEAARFSLLLSIPTIIAAGALKGFELATNGQPIDWVVLVSAFIVAAVSAYSCIALFLRLIERVGMVPFVVYRVLLGAYLFYLFT